MTTAAASIFPASHVCLKPYNSLAVPAVADFLVKVANIDELTQALNFAQAKHLNYLVLGEGSNSVFISDYAGLIILNRIRGIELVEQTDEWVEIKAGAGENWHHLVEHTLSQGWYGLENLALIPGLVGAAPMQNIGAYGVELKDVLTSVQFYDSKTNSLESFNNAQCEFAYRESWFKQNPDSGAVITSINLRLRKIPAVNIDYPSLARQILTSPTPEQVFKAVCKLRKAKLPMPKQIPNAGSFFKNPVVNASQLNKLRSVHSGLVSYPVGRHHKLAAAWLIESAGWKQQEFDGVRVHQHQALVIINPHCRPGSSVLGLAQLIQRDIQQKFGVSLDIEPRIQRS